MRQRLPCLCVCAMLVVATWAGLINDCRQSKYVLNVVFLEDDGSLWSLRDVKAVVTQAIKKQNEMNVAAGLDFPLTANFHDFDTTSYEKSGCGSTTCEGVRTLKQLINESSLGCVMLGPSCTYATFQIIDVEKGMSLSIPIITPGSFGVSCDKNSNLTRLLLSAHKVSNFLVNFWNFSESIKPQWKTAYVYKKPDNSEHCFWYIHALDPQSGLFFTFARRMEILRNQNELHNTLKDNNRLSNLFIICGNMSDVVNLTRDIDLSPEVVFILIDLYQHDQYRHNATVPNVGRNVLVVTVPYQINQTYDSDLHTIKPIADMNDYLVGYHDGVVLFSHVIRQMELSKRKKEGDSAFVNPFRNISFDGLGGHYEIDVFGDRDMNLSVMYLSTETNQYTVLYEFDTAINQTTRVDPKPSFFWGASLPDDIPSSRKGFFNDIVVILLSATVFVVTTIALAFYWQNRKACEIQKKWSHIDPTLIFPLDDKEKSLVSLKIDEDQRKVSTERICRGRYDKKMVILKELKHTDGCFSETQRIELNALLRIDYYNLTKFYGTVQYEHGVYGVFEFCERGSLRSVLNDKISYPDETFMDLEFKISVMYDIAKGMSYLHSSNISVHGRLKSTNCVVDNRMVVKITDFGCNTILIPDKDLWTAPEHLRKQGTSQKGDVYSYAIIAQEILLRKCPFYREDYTDRDEKLYKVENPGGSSIFRPSLNYETTGDQEPELHILIRNCWDEDPEKRPDFKKIESSLGKIISLHNQANESYMDNLIRRLQMYSRNLEHLVEERTVLYKAERDRADQLNFMLLPRPVVRSLKETGRVQPELFKEVTIYFSDIVGFTMLCRYSTPMEVVNMLNDIYKNFDSILDHHDVYKVETIGDAYMVASGLPRRNGNRHAVDICRMALDILSFMGTFQLRHLPGLPVWIRIGVHSGPCAAGVVGVKMPRYCLFGDTVNTASRMESTGLPLHIHVSQPTINILQRTHCKFAYKRRGETYLKGRGTETTYWLTGVTGDEYNLPTPPTAENSQQLQQHLAEMIVSHLEKRSLQGVTERRSFSIRQKEDPLTAGQPEYLHLGTLAEPSTYL